MSHFTVLVIGENVEKQLEPFQENNMEDCPKEYLKFNATKDEYEKATEKTKKEYPTLKQYAEDYHGHESVDGETGEYGYWENPNAKWDWWEVGGRWTGFFKMKDGAKYEVGSPGLMGTPAQKGFGDSALKRDIDFSGMKQKAHAEAIETYKMIEEIFGGKIPEVTIKWEDLVKQEELSYEKKREVYHNQPAMMEYKRIKDEKWESLMKDEKKRGFAFIDLQDFSCTAEQYAEEVSLANTRTFAVLKDGKWYERGKMGWWASVSSDIGEKEWNQKYQELLDSLSDDTLLTVVDCHI